MTHSMNRRLISSGSTFEEQIGYSRAVVAGDWIFVSGTTGFDYTTVSIADNLLQQTEQCLQNIESALRQAGSSLAESFASRMCCPMPPSSSNAGPCCASTSGRCVRRG
jgi:enamine deaminase RidA (YjgF/YER057c/UK114 family)